MARAIRERSALGQIPDVLSYKMIQMRSPVALSAYEMCYPERIDTFGRSERCVVYAIENSPEDVQDTRQKPGESSARHALRHDAESIFWILAWWTLNASPANAKPTSLHPTVYATFADDERDLRPICFVKEDFETMYAPMTEVLNQLGSAIKSDLFWADQAPYNYPDYLHECMQRLILDFLFKNKDVDYMHLPTSGGRRLPGPEQVSSSYM